MRYNQKAGVFDGFSSWGYPSFREDGYRKANGKQPGVLFIWRKDFEEGSVFRSSK